MKQAYFDKITNQIKREYKKNNASWSKIGIKSLRNVLLWHDKDNNIRLDKQSYQILKKDMEKITNLFNKINRLIINKKLKLI